MSVRLRCRASIRASEAGPGPGSGSIGAENVWLDYDLEISGINASPKLMPTPLLGFELPEPGDVLSLGILVMNVRRES